MKRAVTSCAECGHDFDPISNPASKHRAILAGALAGGYFGAQTGLALGPYGAISGLFPGALVGGAAGASIDRLFVKCPYCAEVQRGR